MRNRRALSTVVGMVFFTTIMITGLSYVSYSLDVVGNFSEQTIAQEKRQMDILQEEFEISKVSITPSNKLNLDVKNTGNIPIEIKTLWIDDTSLNDDVERYVIDTTIPPGGTSTIGDSLTFTMNSGKSYDMKITTSRGNTESFFVNNAGSESLFIDLFASPTTISDSFSTNIFMTVVNNSTNNKIFYNLKPKLSIVQDGASVTLVGDVPSAQPSLKPGDTTTFTWEYTLVGDPGSSATFTGTLENGIAGNYDTTTVKILEVSKATEAGQALESFGLSSNLAAQGDIFYFHDDADGVVLSGALKMDGSDPPGQGKTFALPDNATIQFLSAGMNANTTVANGTWNAKFNYFSNPVPISVTLPDLAFFFDCDNCGKNDGTSEAIGNIGKALRKQGTAITWSATGGPFNDGYYSFSEDPPSFLRDDWNVDGGWESQYTNPKLVPDSTVAIVRIPPMNGDLLQTMIFFGDKDNKYDEDRYEITVGDGTAANEGKIVFHYDPDKGNSPTTCTSNDRWDNSTWVFVAAIRPDQFPLNDDDCQLWINGYKVDEQDLTYVTNNDIKATFIGIGANKDDEDDPNEGGFDGDVAMWAHWNNHQLTESEILELNSTRWGEKATRLDFKIAETDNSGTITETYNQTLSYEFPFVAPNINAGDGDDYSFLSNNSTDAKYSQYNFTSIIESNPIRTLEVDQHVLFQMDWVSESGNLPFNMRVDDSSMDLPDGPSFLQSPKATPKWPTYLEINRNDEVSYVIFNEGPSGVWFTSQGTRLVTSTIDGLESYGGIVKSINGSSLSPSQDSLYIPANTWADLKFTKLANPPNDTPVNQEIIPEGDYNMGVYMAGYDEEGEVFLRTIRLGLVHVNP